ncbi:MAG: SUMF1/EgtB/PvdO family nonheme iron enzyme [Burkholderiales bacterium]|nr:SUMF1/EgtB/PvdO family nonheme iron enzyme [Burkholderiales bacterium]
MSDGTPPIDALSAQARAARTADAAALAHLLADTRARTLAVHDAYARALPGLSVPQRGDLNPPLWELGHIGWFQEWWIGRNPQKGCGIEADPAAPRAESLLPNADALYDSSAVPHVTRWSLPLPDAGRTHAYLADSLDESCALLLRAGTGDADLYFYRLALFHEDMHSEAGIYMAHGLGFAVPEVGVPEAHARRDLAVAARRVRLGGTDGGFAFDNELANMEVALADHVIDSAPVSNADFAAFVTAGGYADARLWSEAGRAWLAQTGATTPRFWRRAGSDWERHWFDRWVPLAAAEPVMNLTCHEAEAWCAWAGRRLPTEAEWEHAALYVPGFAWGSVWEWTASPFAPYPGFVAHPYRDYSAPWFGSRRVLRGASVATHARMRHARYRNFFTPDRNDIFAGFRSCAL